jgi:hypothetical protein
VTSASVPAAVLVKFDLSRRDLQGFAELSAVADRELACRVSLVVRAVATASLSAGAGAAIRPGTEYAAIQVPSVEGNEIWLVARALLAELDRAAGFAKPSQPLLVFGSDRIVGMRASNPLTDTESALSAAASLPLDAGTGAALVEPAMGASAPAGFDATIIAQLRNAGHLVAEPGLEAIA